ncbi:MAG: hypothetical protein AB8G77_11050, partial [Rhodothermales bacterium]
AQKEQNALVSFKAVFVLFARPKSTQKGARQINAHFYPHLTNPYPATLDTAMKHAGLSPWLNASIKAPAQRRAFGGISPRTSLLICLGRDLLIVYNQHYLNAIALVNMRSYFENQRVYFIILFLQLVFPPHLEIYCLD